MTTSIRLSALVVAASAAVSASAALEATAISEVFGDGAKITTVALNYGRAIDGASLDTTAYSVDSRQVTAVYTSATPQKGMPSESGQYVIIELRSDTKLQPNRPMGGPGGRPMERRAGGPGHTPRVDTPYADTVWVTQNAAIKAADGQNVAPEAGKTAAINSRVLVADDFTQGVFTHAATGVNLRYNLFTPAGVKPGERYPLVLFMHDASGAGRADTRHTLLQGNGATVWASPEWQAKHPCYVVAPQFDQVTVGDDFSTTADLDACLALIDSLIANCAIDPYRVYTTGQSMGCMSSYELMYRRPDLFASAMLVAGQWNPAVMPSLARMNLWLLTCKGDDRSSQGIAQAIEVWNGCGAKVVEQEWPLLASPQERDLQVAAMLRAGGNIHYTHFAGGSHNNTWRVAYYIDGVREWLFQQRRPLPADSIVALTRDAASANVIVAACQGDAHGATPGSSAAIAKALMKGALMALVDVTCDTDGIPRLASGETLEAALDTVGDGILLLARVGDDSTAAAVESLAGRKGRTSQIALYGSPRGTSLNHVAVVDANQATADDIARALSLSPIAVEIDYTGQDDSPELTQAISLIKPHARILFNTSAPGLAGGHSDPSPGPLDAKATWEPLVSLGGTVILTGQIKPLLTWLNSGGQ